MFERPHHQRIAKILQAFDRDFLQQAECYFGGGTAIVLALNEYRESVDIDFLCSSSDGYRLLRNAVSTDLGRLLKEPVKHLRDVRTDQYKIYTVLEIDGIPVKVELVREARIPIQGAIDSRLNIPVLSRADMYSEKLLANTDRGLDRSVMSRDIIDLSMMIKGWGEIPSSAWAKAYQAYGEQLAKVFHKSVGLICDRVYLASCLRKMQMDEGLADSIPDILEEAAANLPLEEKGRLERDRRISGIAMLQHRGGAAYTFWRHANEYIKAANSPDDVRWAEVERATIRDSIAEHGQPPESVADVVCAYSPGAVASERQAVIRANVERLAPSLNAMFEHARVGTKKDFGSGPAQ